MRKHCGVAQLGRVAVHISGVCCLGALSHFGCAPGELSDGQQRAFRNELRDNYPEPEEDEVASDEMSEDEAATDEATADETADEATADETPADETADEVADEAATDETPADETADEVTDEAATDDAPNESEAGTPAEPALSPCVQELFQTGCSGSLCHHSGAINLPPDFEQDDLLGFLTSNGPACSDTARYVNLDDPLQSFIWLKVQGQQPIGCGTQMPPVGAPPLSTVQLDCLEAWFASLEQ